VQLLVQLADALGQLGQLLSNDRMVDDLGRVCLHVKALRQEVRIALCEHIQTLMFIRGPYESLISVHL